MTSVTSTGNMNTSDSLRSLLSGLASCEPLIQLHEKHPESSVQFRELANCIRQDASKEAQTTGASEETKKPTAVPPMGEDTSATVAEKAFAHFQESVSFNSPRGRFHIAFSEDAMFLTKTSTGKAANPEEAMPVVTLKRSNVRHVFKMDIKDQYQSVRFIYVSLLRVW
eukprot:gb/GECG01007912.1/.p1 GENE.gb/GECG01007912.1/~~gb/GECG01007912.1/.p1  ORF type:complete len:168 (+),score=28.88 gb/GECG01007912.1/:1-504(+)